MPIDLASLVIKEYTQVEFVLVQYDPHQISHKILVKTGRQKHCRFGCISILLLVLELNVLCLTRNSTRNTAGIIAVLLDSHSPLQFISSTRKELLLDPFVICSTRKELLLDTFVLRSFLEIRCNKKERKKVGNVRETCKVKESLNSSFLKLDKVGNTGSKGFFGMIQAANKVNSSGI